MANVDIEIDLDNDTIHALIDVYIKMYMSSASYEVFTKEKNGFMIAAANALKNEAIIMGIKKGIECEAIMDSLKEGIKNDNMPETQD